MAEKYIGTELDLFAEARTWKRYWSGVLRPYLGSHVLDVGAGIGGTAKLYGDINSERYLALEPDPALCLRMRDEVQTGVFPPNFEVVTGTLQSLDEASRFDTILYIDVLEHIELDRVELEQASRMVSPGGRLVVLSPAHQWLYSEFDAAIGHFRRYNRESLTDLKPDSLQLERIFYLDCVGMMASLANRMLLKASSPSSQQISLWDRHMVPVSRRLDPLFSHRLGKTIVAIFKRPAKLD